ncbi:MAG: tyrosine-type recombinase/integrase [Sulfuricaulis sp.]
MPIFKRGGIWWVTVSFRGQRIRTSVGKRSTKAQAQELEAKIRGDIHAGRVGRKPERLISEALLKWLDNECQQLKSAKKFESHARALLPFVAGKTLQQVHTVTEDIKRGLSTLSHATINRRLSILRRVTNIAHRQWGWLDVPLSHRINLLPENSARHLYLTREEVEQLAKSCKNKHARDMIRLAAFTGLRRGELLGLTAENVTEDCIRLDSQTKTGRPRLIPVPREAKAILARLPLPISDSALRKQFEAARKAIKRPEIHFHDLRHTYASWLVQAGAPLTAVRDLLGHSTLSMTSRYAHLSPGHLRAAVKLMSVGHNAVTKKHAKKT